jgi:enterochelin esterase-like enzyme
MLITKVCESDASEIGPGTAHVLGPQSNVLFALLILGFAGLMFWMVQTRRAVLKISAAVLAFVLAMQVGILAVNRYFDYYPTWGSAIDDLTNPGPAVAQFSDSSLVNSSYGKSVVPTPVDQELATRQGFTFEVELRGRLSHISRRGLIYLPPQYFQAQYRHYQFPVIELIHGQPGVPQDWINVAGATAVLDELVTRNLARPAVLVMPDANGGQRISLQCLNVPHGPADMTYLGQDVPADVEAMLAGRVQPVGPAWGIAGYSEGGYCAANLALHLRRSYGYAGVLSGYFYPQTNDLLADGRQVRAFASKHQFFANAPAAEVRALHPGAVIPQFWVGAGAADRPDVQAADYFAQLLALYQVVPPVHVAAGGHTMGVWRAEIPAMLEWMTTKLAQTAVILREHAVALAKHEPRPCRKLATDHGKLLLSRQLNDGKRGAHLGPPFISCPHRAPRVPAVHH